MIIAVTADVHLTSLAQAPERYHALDNILDQLVKKQIDTLVIAGDLFNQGCEAPGEFERLVGQPQYAGIRIYVLPGNHDPRGSAGTFARPNITYITEPRLVALDAD
ncbi:MAG: metallophosphoesterase family protein, partial [Anaerolineae bacterium]